MTRVTSEDNREREGRRVKCHLAAGIIAVLISPLKETAGVISPVLDVLRMIPDRHLDLYCCHQELSPNHIADEEMSMATAGSKTPATHRQLQMFA